MSEFAKTVEHHPLHEFLGAARWGMQHGLRTWLSLQSEAMQFATKRAGQNCEYLWCLTRCASPQEAYRIQQRWLADLAADYAEEWGRMAGTSTDLVTASLYPFKGLTHNKARAPEWRRAA
jgi:hypothetical protein